MTAPDRIEFTLQQRLPLLGKQLRSHWAKRRRAALSMAWEIAAAIPRTSRPQTPWTRATVLVERYGPTKPDRDNLVSCVKPMLDILQPLHAKNRPLGLGIIANDNDDCIELSVVHVQSNLKQTRVTLVREA